MDQHYLWNLDWDSMSVAQKAINDWANKTFPDRVPEASLVKLVMEEIPELLAHRKEKGTEGISGELADCFILLLDLATIWDVDVGTALFQKMSVNIQRQWTHDPATGFYNHIKED
jgi:NTP pyrophosphatase (non-canonical NTP hydrolase)